MLFGLLLEVVGLCDGVMLKWVVGFCVFVGCVNWLFFVVMWFFGIGCGVGGLFFFVSGVLSCCCSMFSMFW